MPWRRFLLLALLTVLPGLAAQASEVSAEQSLSSEAGNTRAAAAAPRPICVAGLYGRKIGSGLCPERLEIFLRALI
jgi:hypothetical protein